MWMLLERVRFTLDGVECNKIGVSYEAFSGQPNFCSSPFESCLQNQLWKFWDVSSLNLLVISFLLFWMSLFSFFVIFVSCFYMILTWIFNLSSLVLSTLNKWIVFFPSLFWLFWYEYTTVLEVWSIYTFLKLELYFHELLCTRSCL